MKIALSSYTGYGAWFALKLLSEGHSVKYYLSHNRYIDILKGLVPQENIELDHRRRYDDIGFPDYSNHDLSIFDLTGKQRQAAHSAITTPTIGDGAFHCRLEDDRLAGIELMEAAHIAVPAYEVFNDIDKAVAFVQKTGKRYVFKPNGGQDQDAATTYVSKDAEDLLNYLEKLSSLSKGIEFILQEFTPGTECSVEGWFNGTDFYCINATLEEKKFMNGGIGPNTGCSGNLVFPLNSKARIFTEGLGKVAEILRGSSFRGMLDLNTIVTESNVYGLEWTPRFGYDATATFANLYSGSFGDLLQRVAKGEIPEEGWRGAFGASTRISIPPYPTGIKMPKMAGILLKGIDPEDEDQILKTYLYDVHLDSSNNLVTSGVNGFVCAPIEIGSDFTMAFDKLEDTIKHIQIPNMQYRTDLRSEIMKRYHKLDSMGWFSS